MPTSVVISDAILFIYFFLSSELVVALHRFTTSFIYTYLWARIYTLNWNGFVKEKKQKWIKEKAKEELFTEI